MTRTKRAGVPLSPEQVGSHFRRLKTAAERKRWLQQLVKNAASWYPNVNTRLVHFVNFRKALKSAGASEAEVKMVALTAKEYEWRDAQHQQRVGRRQLTQNRFVLKPRWYIDAALKATRSKDPMVRLLGVQALTGRRNIEIMERGHLSPSEHPGWAWFSGQAKKKGGNAADAYLIPILHPGGIEALTSLWEGARRDLKIQPNQLQRKAEAAVLAAFGMPFRTTTLLRSAWAAYTFAWLRPAMQPRQWIAVVLGHRTEIDGSQVPDRETAESYDRWDIEMDGDLPEPVEMPHLSVLMPGLVDPPTPAATPAATPQPPPPSAEPPTLTPSATESSPAPMPAPVSSQAAEPASAPESTQGPVKAASPQVPGTESSSSLSEIRRRAQAMRAQGEALLARAKQLEDLAASMEALAAQAAALLGEADVVEPASGDIASAAAASPTPTSPAAAPAAPPNSPLHSVHNRVQQSLQRSREIPAAGARGNLYETVLGLLAAGPMERAKLAASLAESHQVTEGGFNTLMSRMGKGQSAIVRYRDNGKKMVRLAAEPPPPAAHVAADGVPAGGSAAEKAAPVPAADAPAPSTSS